MTEACFLLLFLHFLIISLKKEEQLQSKKVTPGYIRPSLALCLSIHILDLQIASFLAKETSSDISMLYGKRLAIQGTVAYFPPH